MTGKQLKNSILQWAIQGKLVPQDPNDEPASVLLERIRAEKARLVKEGKIKKDKNESIIFRGEDNSYYEKFSDGKVVCIDDEIPFEIPNSWMWVRFKHIANFYNGDRSKNYPNKNEYVSEGIPWINTGHITGSGYLSESTMNYISYEKYQSLSGGFIMKGDLVYCLRGATYGKVARVEPYEVGAIASSLLIIRPICIKLRDYLFYYLNTQLSKIQLNKYANGAAQPNLAAKDVENYLIPLPAISEQFRIIKKIDELFVLVDKYGRAQESLDKLNSEIKQTLNKSILQEAIQGRLVPQNSNDEPATILLERVKTEKQRLVKEGKLKKKDIIDSVIFKGDDNKYYETIAGQTNEVDLPYSFPSSWKIVRLQTICSLLDGEKKTGRGMCLDAKYLRGKSTGEYIQTGKYVHKGDNIILVDGENSGEVFNVPTDGYMGSTFKQLWISNTMYVPYILECIRFYQNDLRNSKKGAAIPHLNKDYFKNLIIGIPPLLEQKKIMEKIKETNCIIGN